MLQQVGLAAVGVSLPTATLAQSASATSPVATDMKGLPSAPLPTVAPVQNFTRLNRYPRSVQDYYMRRVREVELAADARRAALRTKADAERYVADVRAKFAQVFGPFPAKTPLKARVTAVHERDGYRIENVIFESRPNFPVTANLYVPTNRPYPLPGVVGACGHSNGGKGGITYEMFAQGLARQGYVTLIFDPMGQGERLQYTTAALKPKFGIATGEHTYSGVRLGLTGENLHTWFAWDGIRALDYLLSRPEVDPDHVGITGNSGGGGQTTWLCALEPRFTMAVPSCFVTTLRRSIENENSQDPEQFPRRLLSLGLDHSDAIAAMAPKPIRILGQERDFFDARGFEVAAARLKHLYRLLGAEQNFDSFLGQDYHGFTQPNREAMYGWFNLHTGITKGQTEPTLIREKPETLRCTPAGQVAALNVATDFSIASALSKTYRATRQPLSGDTLKQAVKEALRLPSRTGVADYQIMRRAKPRGYPQKTFAAYVLETELDIDVVVYRLSQTLLLSRVPRGPKKALLYVAHQSADVELRENAWVRDMALVDEDTAVFACDVRGVGESLPQLSTSEEASKGGVDYFHASCGSLFDFPTAGQRTHDVLRVIDWLKDSGHNEVHVVALGLGAIPATFASVLHDSVTQVTLKHALTSYAEVAETEAYKWPLSVLVPGVLRTFDLPDCYRELARKKLRQVDPVGAAGVPAIAS